MLNAYPAAFGYHKSKTAYKRREKHPPAMVNTTKQLQMMMFLDGRESVCKLVCAVGDCLDTPGRLEYLPGGFS